MDCDIHYNGSSVTTTTSQTFVRECLVGVDLDLAHPDRVILVDQRQVTAAHLLLAGHGDLCPRVRDLRRFQRLNSAPVVFGVVFAVPDCYPRAGQTLSCWRQ